MAVVLSGDGGWRDLDKTIAEDLQRQAVPLVGLDSLRYFWSKKTPAQTASAVAAVIETFMARWRTDKVALIGYSFGADVIPFVYNRLPEVLRVHVVLIALLALSKSADFEITVSGWLGEPPGIMALPVLPQAAKIPPSLMQCFSGQDESDTACPALAHNGVETFRRNGGHHFDHNYGGNCRPHTGRLQASRRIIAEPESGRSLKSRIDRPPSPDASLGGATRSCRISPGLRR